MKGSMAHVVSLAVTALSRPPSPSLHPCITTTTARRVEIIVFRAIVCIFRHLRYLMKQRKKNINNAPLPTVDDENLIRTAYRDKDWAEIKGENSWMIFKVMSEFVEAMDKLAKIGRCVSIFGSARIKPSDASYKMAEAIAYQLVQHGY